MASSLPIVRQVAWLSVVPELIVMGGLSAVANAMGFDHPVLTGVLPVLLLAPTLQFVIPRHHRAGMRLLKRERFADAIPEFQKSYDFFLKHRWVDEWRAWTMFSPIRASYREMALLNLAFCRGQIGQRAESIATYKQTLAEFPKGKVAQVALRAHGEDGAPGHSASTASRGT